jgi:hypothetical protein
MSRSWPPKRKASHVMGGRPCITQTFVKSEECKIANQFYIKLKLRMALTGPKDNLDCIDTS